MISTKKLIKMAKKWQKMAAAGRRRISYNKKAQHGVEKGQFVVYTSDRKRFALPLAYLQSEIFSQLLRMAEEEFGLASDGPITLPCDSVIFEYVICILRRNVGRELVDAVMLSLSPAVVNQQVCISCC